MTKFEEFMQIIRMLRSPQGCPWDREQTHASLKAPCIEEAAEVIGAINCLEKTGNADNLREELGDLLLQVAMHAVIAEEEGLFTMDDVIAEVSEKMVRRHPHVFGSGHAETSGQVLENWEIIKQKEKKGKKENPEDLAQAFDEACSLIAVARARKGL